ncbi:N-acetylmuramoyl-L-alanine amidase [Bacillus sp. FSL W8-1122]
MTKIFIDPGHGGSDPGAVGHGLKEKDLVLTISRHIRDMLLSEYTGVEVKMSRDSDVFLSLAERANLANNWGADYFLSVHINAGGGAGFESFIHTSKSSGSVKAQNTIHPAIMQQIGGTDRGKKNANFAVLRLTKMPAILTENLFIDNANDAAKLKDPAFLTRAARGHVDGLAQAFGLKRKGKASEPSTSKPKKSISQMATEVLNNQHGNGHENRRRSLGISQAEYEKVRAEVNRRAGGGSKAPAKSVDQMAREVLAGKHGNGHETRRKSLGISQAQYNQVRARVNQLA